MNTCHFAGRVGGDAELKYTTNGKAVASFSLAVDNGKDREGDKKEPTWIKVVLWEKRAEALAQYITKGKFVLVTGRASAEAWIDKKSGDAKSRLILTCDNFEFGGGGDSENKSTERAQPRAVPRDEASQEIADDDIPF